MIETRMEISTTMPETHDKSGRYLTVNSAHIGYQPEPGECYSVYVFAHCLTLKEEPDSTMWQRIKAWASGLWGKKA